jgi:hypothetical protein
MRPLILLALLIVPTIANCQQASQTQLTREASFFESILNLKKWVDKLTEQFDDIVAKEKRSLCKRQLGYLGSDLDLLATNKMKFSTSIQGKSSSQLIGELQSLTGQVDDVLDRINDINILVNDNFKGEGNTVILKLKNEIINRKIQFIGFMYEDIQNNRTEKLKADSEKASKLLSEASQAVWDLRGKITD